MFSLHNFRLDVLTATEKSFVPLGEQTVITFNNVCRKLCTFSFHFWCKGVELRGKLLGKIWV